MILVWFFCFQFLGIGELYESFPDVWMGRIGVIRDFRYEFDYVIGLKTDKSDSGDL